MEILVVVALGGKVSHLSIFERHYLASVWTIKVGVESQEFKLIWYRGFGGETGFAGLFVSSPSAEDSSEWAPPSTEAELLRKFGKCESKLKVLSCQPAIRQQGGCNELSVYVYMCVYECFWESETERGAFDCVCVCLLGCVCVTKWYFSSFSPSHLFPSISFTHTHTHTVTQVPPILILMRREQNSLPNTADLSSLTTLKGLC